MKRNVERKYVLWGRLYLALPARMRGVLTLGQRNARENVEVVGPAVQMCCFDAYPEQALDLVLIVYCYVP